MNLKNITLKTAELGAVNWQEIEKLQPSEKGFICFISYSTISRENEQHLIGNYIQTDFQYKPTYKEVINYIISKEYPNGKEYEILRKGISNPQNSEYLDYYNNVEDIVNTIKNLLT